MDSERPQTSSEASSSTRPACDDQVACALCPKPGLRCGNCWQVNYCSKEHQMEHHPIHKANCKPYKIATNSTLGRHLVATRPIQAWTSILKSMPAVVGPWSDGASTCLGCGKKRAFSRQFLQCSSCGFPMCSKVCEKSPWHASECAAISTRGNRQTREAVLLWCQKWPFTVGIAIFTLRCLLLQGEERLKILQLQSHLEEMRVDKIKSWFIKEAIAFIRDTLGLIEFSREDIWNMSSKAIINSMLVRDQMNCKLTALHTSDLTLVESSCLPSAFVHYKSEESVKAILIARKVIQPGEHISVSYCHVMKGNISRQIAVRSRWYFSCVCRRCNDPTELGLHVNSICCPKCRGLGKMSMAVCSNPIDIETSQWKCEVCDYTMSVQLHLKLGLSHSILPDNLEAHETFLENNLWPRGLLHPMHEFIINSKEKIVNYIDIEKEDLPKYMEMLKDLEHFHRKISTGEADEYCRRIAVAEFSNLRKEFASNKWRGNKQNLKEKLLSFEEQIMKPLSYPRNDANQLNLKILTDSLKEEISKMKQKCS